MVEPILFKTQEDVLDFLHKHSSERYLGSDFLLDPKNGNTYYQPQEQSTASIPNNALAEALNHCMQYYSTNNYSIGGLSAHQLWSYPVSGAPINDIPFLIHNRSNAYESITVNFTNLKDDKKVQATNIFLNKPLISLLAVFNKEYDTICQKLEACIADTHKASRNMKIDCKYMTLLLIVSTLISMRLNYNEILYLLPLLHQIIHSHSTHRVTTYCAVNTSSQPLFCKRIMLPVIQPSVDFSSILRIAAVNAAFLIILYCYRAIYGELSKNLQHNNNQTASLIQMHSFFKDQSVLSHTIKNSHNDEYQPSSTLACT